MSNHCHQILKINKTKALALSEEEVVQRWTQVFTAGNRLVDEYLAGGCSAAIAISAQEIIEEWRQRLYSISWFMARLNGEIARKANKEDNCTGHFWEQRFKSQALLDFGAILSCMLYVDLNPVRAGVANDLSGSDFTSVQERIVAYDNAQKKQAEMKGKTGQAISDQPESLLPFESVKHQDVIRFSLLDYLALADWTGRQIHPDKKGFIKNDIPDIISILARDNGEPQMLKELGIETEDLLDLAKNFCKRFAYFAGNVSGLNYFANQRGEHWYKGAG